MELSALDEHGRGLKVSKRLKALLEEPKSLILITNDHLQTVDVHLKNLITVIKENLKGQLGLVIGEIRLVGEVAGKLLRDEPNAWLHDDLDFIFKIDAEIVENQLHSVRSVVVRCVNAATAAHPADKVRRFVISKMTKVWNEKERWSLFRLGSSPGTNVNLIFVSRMARAYFFSIDSVQIVIDPVLLEQSENGNCNNVVIESCYGDISEVLEHIRNKTLVTRDPELIRGGGLLRYCDLLSRGFHPPNGNYLDYKTEQLMSSRFFIDFCNVTAQVGEIEVYLQSHFLPGASHRKCHLMRLLIDVIQRASVCIMNHERRLIVTAISGIIARESVNLNSLVCFENNKQQYTGTPSL